jgi:ubiquinone/menaquinone biosynthesis C-methylase UbiE
LTLDVGCGEGRVARDLKARGHRVVAFDGSPTLVAAACAEDPHGEYILGDAVALPIADAAADLVVSFMALHDVDDVDAAVAECARTLSVGGRLCAAIVHPLNSAGRFADGSAESPFVISRSYLDEFRYEYAAEKDGLHMTFHSRHRSLEAFTRAFEAAGLLIEAIREPPVRIPSMSDAERQWLRLPLFLHVRAVKPA